MNQNDRKPIRLFLVDNLEDGLKTLAEMLRRRYEAVDVCESMQEALERYESGRYDVVIVSLEMDRDEGYRTINAVYDKNPDQRFITYSEEPDHPSNEAGCKVCLEQNRRHRIKKPVVIQELYDEIEKFDMHHCMFAKTAMEMYGGYA
jgi:CheY-like chemotaxis protein